MAIPLYLAMTGAEFYRVSPPPAHVAWLSCQFSPWGKGIVNLPEALPAGSVLILSDELPPRGHDPELVRDQLLNAVERLKCGGVLLDFQRHGSQETADMANALMALPCPGAVAAEYADGLDCAVFLPPVPPDILPEVYLKPWAGREIWLEAALNGAELTVTAEGVRREESPGKMPGRFYDEGLYCHYSVNLSDSAQFHLQRTWEDLPALLGQAEKWGVTKAVGLFQELGVHWGKDHCSCGVTGG